MLLISLPAPTHLLRTFLVSTLLLATAPRAQETGGGNTPDAPGTPGQESGGQGKTTPEAGGTPPVLGPPPKPPETAGALPIAGDLANLESWTWWWEFNREPYLALRANMAAPRGRTTDSFYLGPGQKFEAQRFGPSEADVRERVLPILTKTLRSKGTQALKAACVIAIARIGDDLDQGSRAELGEVLHPYLRARGRAVPEATLVAFGLLGHTDAVSLLCEILTDSRAGRRLLNQGSVPQRMRAFAAYGLALAGRAANEDVRRYIVHRLASTLTDDRTAGTDLAVACVLGIGQLPLAPMGKPDDPFDRVEGERRPASTCREAQVVLLLELLNERRTPRLVRAHVPTTVALLLADGLAPRELEAQATNELLSLMKAREGVGRELVRSSVLALGSIADADADPLDAHVRKTLRRIDSTNNDRITRAFALISLARIAARPGDGEPADLEAVRAHLSSKLGSGGEGAQWAALALALFESGRVRNGADPDHEVEELLRQSLAEARSPANVGARAIAAGLLRRPETGKVLLARFAEITEENTLGHVALGLGLSGAGEAREPIFQAVHGEHFRPVLQYEGSIALGLLGDTESGTLLAQRLSGCRSLSAQAAIARAVGRIGGESSVTPLIEALESRTQKQSARVFAAAALGAVADRDELPWNSPLGVGLNYLAAPPTLFDMDGTGFLNLL